MVGVGPDLSPELYSCYLLLLLFWGEEGWWRNQGSRLPLHRNCHHPLHLARQQTLTALFQLSTCNLSTISNAHTRSSRRPSSLPTHCRISAPPPSSSSSSPLPSSTSHPASTLPTPKLTIRRTCSVSPRRHRLHQSRCSQQYLNSTTGASLHNINCGQEVDHSRRS